MVRETNRGSKFNVFYLLHCNFSYFCFVPCILAESEIKRHIFFYPKSIQIDWKAGWLCSLKDWIDCDHKSKLARYVSRRPNKTVNLPNLLKLSFAFKYALDIRLLKRKDLTERRVSLPLQKLGGGGGKRSSLEIILIIGKYTRKSINFFSVFSVGNHQNRICTKIRLTQEKDVAHLSWF